MKNLLDKIKEAVTEETASATDKKQKAIKEAAFRGDEGTSFVPDVEFHKDVHDARDMEKEVEKVVEEDDDKKDDENVVAEDQENRDEDDVDEKNKKIEAGLDVVKEDEDKDDDETVSESDDEDEEKKEIAEKLKQESKVTKEDFDLTEDLAAIFGDDNKLSEKFKNRAKTVFEAAVVAKTNEVLSNVIDTISEAYVAEKARLAETMVDQVDAYLDKVVEEWYEENRMVAESKLRLQVTESFMAGLKHLFEEHYIEIPEGKEDLLAKVIKENTEVTDKLEEEISKNVALRKQITELKKEKLIAEASENLSVNQADKLKMLAEGVDFISEDDFNERLVELKESFFERSNPKKVRSIEEDNDPIQLTEDVIDRVPDEVKAVSSVLDRLRRK